jgi:hypothetical protein
MQAKQLSFGVEIECFSPVSRTQSQVIESLRAAGVRVDTAVGMHTTTPGWKVVGDGSLRWNGRSVRYGIEIVSPVLKGDAGLAEVARVAEVLESIGCKVNTSCGLHVHVGIGGATGKQAKNIAASYLKYADEMDSIMPMSRRGVRNAYCKNNKSAMFAGQSAEQIDATLASTRDHIDAVARLMNGSAPTRGYVQTRYFALNFQSYATHGTVEFRQHSGTTNPAKIVAWVKLVTGLVANAMSVDTIRVAGSAGFDKMLRKVDPSTAEFYRARRAAFANATA